MEKNGGVVVVVVRRVCLPKNYCYFLSCKIFYTNRKKTNSKTKKSQIWDYSLVFLYEKCYFLIVVYLTYPHSGHGKEDK